MQYLLDTNICIALIKGHPGIRAKILTIGLENCFVPDISIAECSTERLKASAPNTLKTLISLSSTLRSYP